MRLRFLAVPGLLCLGLCLLLATTGRAQPLQWDDKRPIARWFIAEHTRTSATNPRGYLWNPTLDALDPGAFHAAILAQTQNNIERLNRMVPRPQGVLIWDLEGQEFPHAITYIGDPTASAVFAPEMDAIADTLFAMLRSAGYRVGVTIRPQNALEGQSVSDDDAVVYQTLHDKMAYAISRWGARLFYIDSDVYTNGSWNHASIFQRLATDFPGVLMIPEWSLLETWSVAAGYFDQSFERMPPAEVLAVYPDAFAVIQGLRASYGPGDESRLRQRVRQGNILFVDAWWDNPANEVILRAYRAVYGPRGGG